MTTATLPVGWKSATIGEIATVVRGASPRPIASPRWFSNSSEVGWVRIADLGRSDGLTLRSTTQRLSSEGVARSRYLPPGTLILSIAATVGVPIVTGIPTCIHDGFVAIKNLKGVDQLYLLYALKASQGELRGAGQTGSQSNVNTYIVKGLRVPLPSLGEQTAIAEALTDADQMIISLERLIAKKQEINQSMMQRLLTGKTRLPCFSGDWQPLPVASTSVMKARIGWQGLKADEYRQSGTYRLVGGTDFIDGRVDWDQTPFVDQWRYNQDSSIQLQPGDVLLTKDGSIGKTAFVESSPGPATLNSGVFVIRPVKGAYDPHFMFYMLRSRAFEDFLARLSAGSTISHLYQRDLVTLVLDIPPTLDEQRAIAGALSDVEREIRALVWRLEKARLIKKGMMQELLTGRVRLSVGSSLPR